MMFLYVTYHPQMQWLISSLFFKQVSFFNVHIVDDLLQMTRCMFRNMVLYPLTMSKPGAVCFTDGVTESASFNSKLPKSFWLVALSNCYRKQEYLAFLGDY